jgi:hypothetical protein
LKIDLQFYLAKYYIIYSSEVDMIPYKKIIFSILLLGVIALVVVKTFNSTSDNKVSSKPDNRVNTKPDKPNSDVSDGSRLNRFFPKASGQYDLVFSQEKTGFASANLKSGGKTVALLSITDTNKNPEARDKYDDSEKKVDGYPAVKKGKKGISILVGNRYQVSISAKDDAFSGSDAAKWLRNFDLSGLEKLK